MGDDYLNILDPIIYDNSIEFLQYSEHTPQSQNNLDNPGGIIQIDINATDAYLLPAKSYIQIKGQLVRNDNNNPFDENIEIALVNNAMMYLFENITYQIGTTAVESITSPGQVTSMLGYLSYPDDFNTCAGLMSCWSKDTTEHANSAKYESSAAVAAGAAIAASHFTPRENPNYNQGFAVRRGLLKNAVPRGSFSFLIPFDHVFGFGTYNKVIYNIKHSLKFTRKSTDDQAIHRAANVQNGKVKLTSISWRVPEVKLELTKLVELRDIIESKEIIPVGFQARTTDSTVVNQTRHFTWRTNVISGVEKPRWIIVGFQTDKNETQEQNPAVFDNLNLTSASARLNTEKYPNDDIVINFPANDYAVLYEMFDNFKKEYYGFNSLVGGTQVNFPAFKSLYPIIVFDVRHQNEKLAVGSIDMQLKFKFQHAVPANTYAYVTIISDRVYHLKSDGKNLVMISK
jgi:hypothetical protein